MKGGTEARWLLLEQSETRQKQSLSAEGRAGIGPELPRQLEAEDQQGPHVASSFFSGHLDARESTMASDHQTQAGKPQPLNPKVGTLLEGEAGGLRTPSSLYRVNFSLPGALSAPRPPGTQSPPAARLGPIPCAPPDPRAQHPLPILELNSSASLLSHVLLPTGPPQAWGRETQCQLKRTPHSCCVA